MALNVEFVVEKDCTETALLSRNYISFCQLFHHCSKFIYVSLGERTMGPLQASVPADTRKRKLIRLIDRIRTDGHEEPAVSSHSLQTFHIGSFIGKYYCCCDCPIMSDKMSTLKCGMENVGLLTELFL
jgi:hypothetical protein